MKIAVCLSVAVLAAVIPVSAEPPYIETIEVRVNNVDVIVTDRSGHPVHGLSAKDFELLENRVAQPITNFSEYWGAIKSATAATGEPPVGSALNARRFVLLFDELVLHPHTARALRERALTLAERTMRPEDEVMIVTLTPPRRVVLPFTTDRAAFRRALEEVMYANRLRANTRESRERFLYQGLASQPMRSGISMAASIIGSRVQQTLSYLLAVSNALAEVEGRKIVLLFTDSLPVEPGRLFEPNVEDELTRRAIDQEPLSYMHVGVSLQRLINDVAHTAASNGVAIYPIQPDIPLTIDFPGVQTTPDTLRGVRNDFNRVTAVLSQNEQSFSRLADVTGGMWYRGLSGINKAFGQVASDVTDYYSLGYHSENRQLDKPLEVAVRVRERPDLMVRSRRAVVRKSAANEMRDVTVAKLLDPRPIDELGALVSADSPRRDGRRTMLVRVEIRVPLKNLTLLPDGDVYRGSFRVHYSASSGAVDFAVGEGSEHFIEVPKSRYASIHDKYFTYASTLRLARGDATVAVGVLDPLSRMSTVKTISLTER